MQAKIKIDCETVGELMAHLTDIRRNISIESKGDDGHIFECGEQFYNTNCYGTHEVEIVVAGTENTQSQSPVLDDVSATKPPLGLIPKKFHDEKVKLERFKDVWGYY